MDVSIFVKIGIVAAKFAGQKISKDHRALTILKQVGLGEIKAGDFDTVYAHSLVEYGTTNNISQLTQLFADKDVVGLFKDLLFAENEELKTDVKDKFIQLFSQKLRESKYEWLLEYYKTGEELTAELEKFNDIFKTMTNRSRTPIELEMFNKIKYLEIREFEKSYDYQIIKYNDNLVESFYDKFLKENKYVYQNGEVDQKQHGDVLLQKKELESKKEIKERRTTRKEYEPVDGFINVWLSNQTSNLLIILGEYGTGKTTLCSYIAHQLGEKNSENLINDKELRQPILFKLRDFEKTIEGFIQNELMNSGVTDINYLSFVERIKNKSYVILFDGFDEMSSGIDDDEKKGNFSKLKTIIHQTNSKVIISCRSEFFKTDEELREIFKLEDNNKYELLHLLHFNEDQIKTFLKSHVKDPDIVWEKIETTFDLKDLAERPVLLEMITEHLPKLLETIKQGERINASDLYKLTIQEELERKSSEVKHHITSKFRLQILEEVAVWLFQKDALSFDINIITNQIDFKKFFQNSNEWEFERYFQEFICFTFLIRDGDYLYRFSHKSFLEYLVATKIIKDIAKDEYKLLSEQRLTDSITKFVIEQNPLKENLTQKFYSINNTGIQNKILASNLVVLLIELNCNVVKNKSFNNIVFEEIDFSRIEFNGAKFVSSTFIKCRFRDSLLDAEMIDCDFSASSLDLSFCDLPELPSEIGNLTSLTDLNLSSNQLSALPAEIGNLTSLTDLDLSGNQLSTLPSEVGNLTSLTDLDLRSNQLSTLPSEIGNLTSLTDLYLRSNQLSALPAEIGNLTSLTDLDLSSNQLSALPAEIGNLTLLTGLDLRSNQLSALPAEIGNLTSLTYLYLSGNQLSTLPSEIGNLTSLTYLYLSSNILCKIPEESLEDNKLEKVVFEGNPIPKSLIEEYKKQRPDIEWDV